MQESPSTARPGLAAGQKGAAAQARGSALILINSTALLHRYLKLKRAMLPLLFMRAFTTRHLSLSLITLYPHRRPSTLILALLLGLSSSRFVFASDLWELARESAATHRFSTLFTAHDVKNHLSGEEGRVKAREWCRNTGVTKVYIESFRDGYEAEAQALIAARDDFRKAGFVVSGCVTTTGVGKKSTGWSTVSCYTDRATQEKIREIFQRTAGMFDEIMIDDFWFTDCTCSDCESARKSRKVKTGSHEVAVSGDSWEAYRCELMLQVSHDCVLEAARKVNPKVKIIIKYPQWYDRFHERGYEVRRETEDFDWIWAGTETRDYGDQRWGGTVQYEAYFVMRWLGGIGGQKCGGGWYDWLGTTEKTYIEQARQTILGGARESMLFCYGGLQASTGPANIAALRKEIPELQRVAAEVQRRKPLGLAAYKPINSHPEKEARVFDFVGMLGIPLLPTHQFPTDAPAAFFSVHALSDPAFKTAFARYVEAGHVALITDGLAEKLESIEQSKSDGVHILKVAGEPKSLLALSPEELTLLRPPLLKALGLSFTAPNRVAIYPFVDGSWVIENFNDEPATVELGEEKLAVPGRGWMMRWR